MTEDTKIAIALKAVAIYAETHPRPAHVTQLQAAGMVGISVPTLRKMIRAGNIRLNKFGLIPITEIDRALEA
jgi:hypothetical protein